MLSECRLAGLLGEIWAKIPGRKGELNPLRSMRVGHEGESQGICMRRAEEKVVTCDF